MIPATTLDELQEQIREKYTGLSRRLQQVAEYVLENKNTVAFETVQVIAKQADVPPSTLIRFANAFEFTGFNEMKQVFRNNLLEETLNYTDRVKLLKEMDADCDVVETPSDILNEFANANSNAMQQLTSQIQPEKLIEATAILSQAKNIYVMGLGRSFSIASYMTYALRHLNRRVFLIDGLGGMFSEQLSMVGQEDVVVTISFAPYAKETTDISDSFATSGTKQIVITDSPISPLSSFSDVCFVVKEAQVDAFRSQVASLCLVQALTVSLAFYEQGKH